MGLTELQIFYIVRSLINGQMHSVASVVDTSVLPPMRYSRFQPSRIEKPYYQNQENSLTGSHDPFSCGLFLCADPFENQLVVLVEILL